MNIKIEAGELALGLHDTLKALSDPVRRDILELLKSGRLSAGDIGKHFDLSAATISHHLSQLKKAGLVLETKYKNFIFYELNVTVFERISFNLKKSVLVMLPTKPSSFAVISQNFIPLCLHKLRNLSVELPETFTIT